MVSCRSSKSFLHTFLWIFQTHEPVSIPEPEIGLLRCARIQYKLMIRLNKKTAPRFEKLGWSSIRFRGSNWIGILSRTFLFSNLLREEYDRNRLRGRWLVWASWWTSSRKNSWCSFYEFKKSSFFSQRIPDQIHLPQFHRFFISDRESICH